MNRRQHFILLTALLCMPTARLHAQDTLRTGSTPQAPFAALVEHTAPWQPVDWQARQNPVLHGVAFHSSFSQLYATAQWQRQSTPFVLQHGRGFFMPAAGVDSYLRLTDHTAVWGHASYMNGRQHQVAWNSTSDYDLLQPYVLADTLGGDSHRERYRFEGGYATQLNQWMVGAEMLFRADHEYRDVDPRMRGIVNELTLRLAAGRLLGTYIVATAVEGNVYKQRNSVDFYRELGVIPEYQMTGLGTEYARFSGDKRSLQYDGGGTALLVDATPRDGNGPYAHLKIGQRRYHRLITENYTLPLTDLYTQGLQAVVGWQRSGKAAYVSADYGKRSGDEHIIGTSATTSFPDRGVLTMYKNHRLNTSLTAVCTTGRWQAEARVGYRHSRERYVYPERKLNTAHVYAHLQATAFMQPSRRLMLSARLNAGYEACTGHELLMPFADMTDHVARMIRHTYNFARADYATLQPQLRADLREKAYTYFITVGGAYTHCSRGEHQWDAHATIGITF